MIEQCTMEKITIDATQYGSADNAALEIRVHKVKCAEDKNRPAIVFYRGGAAALLNAEQMEPKCCEIALTCDATIFNVDFRNAPEAKAPSGILDCYSALKYVISKAE